MGTSAQPKALLAELFEAAAAAMGIDKGREHLSLEFEDGRLRRWGRTDPGNGANELGRFDQAAAHELGQLLSAGAEGPGSRLAL